LLRRRYKKDADNFIVTFPNEISFLKYLEEKNINGLLSVINVCSGENIVLSKLFIVALKIIERITIHFTGTESIDFDKTSSSKSKKKPVEPIKEELQQQTQEIPSKDTVQRVANAFSTPTSNSRYAAKYASIAQSWANSECKLEIPLLHRLLFSFLRYGGFAPSDQLLQALPEAPILKLSFWNI
jgi:hypothetical protein